MFLKLLTFWFISNFIMAECQNDKCVYNIPANTKSRNCCEILKDNKGQAEDKVYEINTFGKQHWVECDMKTDGGGWTVIQKRTLSCGPLVDFNAKWLDYDCGFGKPGYSYWLGLNLVYKIVEENDHLIRFDMESFDPAKKPAYAMYNHFFITRLENHTLDISGYSGTAGDSILNPAYSEWNVNGMQFSAIDKDLDTTGWIHCAKDYQGGWWFKDCVDGYPNGLHHESRIYDYNAVTWPTYDSYYSLKSMKISIRNKDKSKCGI